MIYFLNFIQATTAKASENIVLTGKPFKLFPYESKNNEKENNKKKLATFPTPPVHENCYKVILNLGFV